MWQNNKTVSRTYATSHATNCWAIISGITDWKKVKAIAADGVTNVFAALCAARANNRQVDVFIVGNEIERVVLK